MLERVWRKDNLLELLVGMYIDTATMETSTEVSGEFVISSVLSCHRNFEATHEPVLQLGYSSVLFGKQRKIHPQGMKAGRPKRGLEKS